MEQTILTSLQQKVITLIGAEANLHSYYLSGGTALAAYYLQHRLSDDLDFFTTQLPDQLFLHAFTEQLKQKLWAKALRFERLYDRNIFFFDINQTELKMEFTYYPFSQFEQPQQRDTILVDSLRDLAANKLMALVDRLDPKDFVDLFFLLEQFDLKHICEDVEKKFGVKLDAMLVGSSLARVKNIVALPKMVKPLTLEDLKLFFTKQAQQLGPLILGA